MNFPLLLWKYLELRGNGRLTPGELAERRLEKFRRLVRFVNGRSAYYARIVREHGIDPGASVPENFPVLTKSALMEHFDGIVTTPAITKKKIADFLSRSEDPSEPCEGKFIVLRTSGSSGRTGYFVYSGSDWSRGFAQFLRFHDVALRRRTAAYFGSTRGHFAGVTQFLTGCRSLFGLLCRAEAFDINDPLRQFISRLNVLQPEILSGYPSGLLMLARSQLEGSLRIAPSFIYSSGEALSPEARGTIERAFPVSLLDLYDSSEHMLMAISNPGGGMYLLEDDLIFEIHADHACVTNLFNRTLPLIRYRMDDVLEPLPLLAPGRPLPYTRIKNIVGRMEHALFLTNRHGAVDFVSPSALTEFHAEGLRLFQVRVTGRSSFLFRACLEDGLGQEERERTFREIRAGLRQMLARKEMENVTFEIEEARDLRVDAKTGKFRLVLTGANGDTHAAGP